MKCSICLENIDKGETLKVNKKFSKKKNSRYLIKCKHKFHKDCLIKWFNSAKANSDKCPICREPIIFKNSFINKARNEIVFEFLAYNN